MSCEAVKNPAHDVGDCSKLSFQTKAIHVGQDPAQWKSRAVVPPISLSTTFQQFGPDDHAGFVYGRCGNPTRKCLEECIAALEGAKYGLCFSSGLATITALTHLLSAGDHVICFDDVYGETNLYFRTCANRMGIETSFVDARDPANVANAFRSNTKMVWMETPTNPLMKLVDIRAVAEIVKAHRSAFFAVDNTFMSSYFQQPLSLGADVVMHSLTKYMNGHSDVVMGALATNRKEFYEQLKYVQNTLGLVPSPFDCFLVNRGLKTLHLRMQGHMKNGLAVAKFLESHPLVEKVLHPGLPSHPQQELAKRQCTGFSGMVSFYIKGGAKEALAFMRNCKLITLAESLGGVESLVELPAAMTHVSVPKEERDKLGITDNLLRLSIGLEAAEELLSDLDQALRKAVSEGKE